LATPHRAVGLPLAAAGLFGRRTIAASSSAINVRG